MTLLSSKRVVMTDTLEDEKIDMHEDNFIADIPQQKVGETLRAVREEKKISPETIRDKLKIRPRLLTALEEGRYKELPDATTVAALVKTYAHFLGLDSSEFSSAYRDEMQGREKKVDIDFPEMLPRNFKISRIAVIFSLLALAGSALMGWSYYMRKDPFITQDNWKGLVDSSTMQMLNDTNGSQDKKLAITAQHIFPLPDPTVRVEAPKEMLLIAQDEDSWIEVKNAQRRVIFSGILKKGQTYLIPEKDGLILKTGNGAALRLLIDGKLIDVFAKNKRVTRNFSLDRQKLEALVPQDEVQP